MSEIISIKADTKVKREAMKTAKELGFTLSAVVNAYLRQFIKDKAVNFIVERTMTPRLEKELDAFERDIKLNRNFDGPFESPAELKKYFESL